MPAFNSKDLTNGLIQDVQQLLAGLDKLKSLDNNTLNKQPAPGKWSAVQIIEHLNSYNRYYLPEIEKSLSKPAAFNPVFKPGLFGNYFTKMMMPGEGGKISNKMNAPKDHRPAENLDSKKVIAEFIAGQTKLINHLQQAAKTDMAKLWVPISISPFVKLKLGDTFRFLIAHQQRHFVQLNNTLTALAV